MTAPRTWLVLAFLGSACGEVRPTPTLLAVSTVSDHDVWAVGEDGAILHFDGNDWSPMASDATGRLNAIWSIAANDVWAVGEALTTIHWNGATWTRFSATVPNGYTTGDFHGVWGASGKDVWAVADGGVFHWDGSAWSYVGVSGYLDAIYGAAADDIWAVGLLLPPFLPRAFQFDGSTWTDQSKGYMSSGLLTVWASTSNHVWAAGPNGFDEWDGTTWSTLDPSAHPKVTSMWGADANDVWALGADGTIWFWDGTSFLSVYTPTGPLHGIHGSSRDNVWAVGDSGLLVHWDGSTWTTFVQ